MAHDPYGEAPYRQDSQRHELQPGEVPSDPRPAYSGPAIVWIVIAVVLVIGGAVLVGSRDASTPQASIEHPVTTGSSGG